MMHGGRLAEACALYGGAPEDWLDLSTGINPEAWPGAAVIAPDWHRLPDPADLARLEALAARHFGVDPEFCCAVPGSETGLRLLADLLALPGCHRPPCYSSHAEAFAVCHAVFAPDELPAEASVMVLANPNNPDGGFQSHRALRAWQDAVSARGGWLILDEAFIDATPEAGMASRVGEREALIVLRSFGKFFGLAGARLGFVLGPRRVIAALRHRLGAWPVNAGALALGLGAYADTAWIERERGALAGRAGALNSLLTRHALRPSGACPLFRLVETDRAAALFEHLARRRILTRPFTYDARRLRFGLPRGDLDTRLDDALRAFDPATER